MLEHTHLLDLRKSGLTDDTIEKMGVRSMNGMDLAIAVQGVALASKAYAAQGYAIPYFNDQRTVVAERYKMFWTSPTEDSPKYLSSINQHTELYFPPGLETLLQTLDYVVVTEGEKKAAKAVQEGIPCVAIPGVYMWADSKSRALDKAMGKGMSHLTKPLEGLVELAKKNIRFVIAFDSDAAQNKQVHTARFLLKDALLYHCAKWVRVLDLNPSDSSKKWGLDDVLCDTNEHVTFKTHLQDCLKKDSMGLAPLLRFAYDETQDGRALHYEVPNTPYGSTFNIHSILKEVVDKEDNGRVLRKKIATTRVWLSRLVQSADGDNKTLYEIAYIPLDSREPKYMSGGAEMIRLTRATDDPLAEHGARILSKEKPAVEEFLNDCQTYGVRSGKIPRVWGTRRRGWVENLGNLHSSGYVVANRIITEKAVYAAESRDVPLLPVDSGGDGALKEALSHKGDYGHWRDAIRRFVVPAPLPTLMMSAAISGLFRRWCPDSENFIVHLYGESSHGKTTALKAAASCWGAPDKLIDNWRSTDNGLERRCAARNDMVMFLDEAGMAVNEDIIRNSVYMIGNGGEKLRANKDASDRVTRRFQLVALSTGEKQLIRDSKFAGQEVRALELHTSTFGDSLWSTFPSGAEAEQFTSIVNTNYGWAMEKIVQAMLRELKKDPLAIHKVHQHLTQTLRTSLPKNTPAHILRRVKHFGLLLTSWSYMLEYALEYTEEECKELLAKLVKDVAANALQLETDQFKGGENEGILQHLVDQIALHQNKFSHDGIDDTPRNETYGLIKDKKLYAIPSGLAKIMAPFDNARLVQIADTMGALVYNNGKAKQNKKVTVRIGSMRPDCYVFDLDKIDKLLGRT